MSSPDPIRILFFGTPGFAVPFFDFLYQKSQTEKRIEIIGVVTQPDKPVGRKGILTPPAVKVAAQEKRIPVLQPTSLKRNEGQKLLNAYPADLYVVVAYGKIIPVSILTIPHFGAVNVHPSLLPRYRGPSPLQAVITQGDKETGISIMLLDEGMDTGPLLAQKKISLSERETLETLTQKIHQDGPALLYETLHSYASAQTSPIPQSLEGITITSLLDRDDGHINWSDPAIVIDRKIRAYTPWPGCFAVWNRNGKELRLKILEAIPASDVPDAKEPGTVEMEEGRILVHTGSGCLRACLRLFLC